MSFLSTVGKDFKAVFAWLGSTKGQAVVSGVEGAAETVATVVGAGAIVQNGIDLLNKWLAEAVKVETVAAAAESQTGSGTQKAAAVLSVMTPQLTTFLTANGYASVNVASQATAINTAAVTLLNALGTPAASGAAA